VVPEIISDNNFAEPHDIVQPKVPCPVLVKQGIKIYIPIQGMEL
jgi:hypothetical protein